MLSSAERKRLRDEMDTYKSEMDITYREITEIKDQLSDLMQSRKHLENSIRWVGNRMSSAKESGDREESSAYSTQNLRNYDELSALNSEINQRQARKEQLWEQHNDAKDQFRKARDRLRENN
jgi:predicted  nucleic acid-binding Zn-ribbon protein